MTKKNNYFRSAHFARIWIVVNQMEMERGRVSWDYYEMISVTLLWVASSPVNDDLNLMTNASLPSRRLTHHHFSFTFSTRKDYDVHDDFGVTVAYLQAAYTW